MAVRLGRTNVDAMLRGLTAKQFMEWEAYARLEPFNELRADYRAAQIVTMIANVNRGAKQKAYQMDDFLLTFKEQEIEKAEKKKQSWKQQQSIAYAIAMAYSVPARDLGTK